VVIPLSRTLVSSIVFSPESLYGTAPRYAKGEDDVANRRYA